MTPWGIVLWGKKKKKGKASKKNAVDKQLDYMGKKDQEVFHLVLMWLHVYGKNHLGRIKGITWNTSEIMLCSTF